MTYGSIDTSRKGIKSKKDELIIYIYTWIGINIRKLIKSQINLLSVGEINCQSIAKIALSESEKFIYVA